MATKSAPAISKHTLYEVSVQSFEADLDFFERVFEERNGRPLRELREDFCGTAALSATWVRRHKDNRAWGVDIDGPTLEFGRKEHASRLGDASDRLALIEESVLDVLEPKVELVGAQNFSYQVFKTRKELGDYFKVVRQSLKDDGMFVMDVLGGQDSMGESKEDRRITDAIDAEGNRLPNFTYVWEQVRFNPITHDFRAHIHFKLPGGVRYKNAFTYEWRLWTLPELRELLTEAGFSSAEVYVEGWDDEADDTDGEFRKRSYYENQAVWIAYLVGYA